MPADSMPIPAGQFPYGALSLARRNGTHSGSCLRHGGAVRYGWQLTGLQPDRTACWRRVESSEGLRPDIAVPLGW